MSRPRVRDGVELAFASLAWQLGGDQHLVGRLALDADMLAFVEARDGSPRGGRALPLGSWLRKRFHVQHDTRTGARAGSATAVRRRGPLRLMWTRLAVASRPGRRVQTRYLRTTTVKDADGPIRVGVVHFPLEGTGVQDNAEEEGAEWVARVRRRRQTAIRRRPIRWALLTDVNQDPDDYARRLNAPHHAKVDVLGAYWSEGFPADMRARISHHKGTDHGIITLRWTPRRGRAKYRVDTFPQ